jgi:hypothetical protein
VGKTYCKEYDEFRVSPAYIDSVQEMKHDPRFSSIPLDDTIVVKHTMEDDAASPLYKGMEKISNSLEEDLVTSMDTSIFVSPISPADDTT